MKRSVGDLLMWLGAAVGAGGGVLLAMGAWMHLPQALIIAIAKALPFVVAAALLAVGAVVRRSALRAGPVRPPALAAGEAARLAARDAAGRDRRGRAARRRPAAAHGRRRAAAMTTTLPPTTDARPFAPRPIVAHDVLAHGDWRLERCAITLGDAGRATVPSSGAARAPLAARVDAYLVRRRSVPAPGAA